MNVYLNSVDGIADAVVALHMSKRSWTPELDQKIRLAFSSKTEDVDRYMEKLVKWGPMHPTLLKFIDLSFTVEGLHRAGQDDWDSHAKRFDNRIVRSSTRLAKFGAGEKSSYYKDKILTTDEVLEERGISIPATIMKDGVLYVHCVNGYVRSDLADDKDVLRGLYMLSIPSNFIFRCNLTEFAHVYRERRSTGTANPEVKELAEKCADMIEEYDSRLGRSLLERIRN